MWTFGIIGLLHYEITVLTALIPPLIIVIGIPNCIFLINKYQHEVKLHGNKVKSLQRVITKVGNATLMTNVTTASGFATFILTESTLLKEFGIVASLSILGYFYFMFTYHSYYIHVSTLSKRSSFRTFKQTMDWWFCQLDGTHGKRTDELPFILLL